MQWLFPIFRRGRGARGTGSGVVPSRVDRRRKAWAGGVERLERRAMLAVTVQLDPSGSEVYVKYNEVGADGNLTTANQNVIVEVENLFFPLTQTRVNIYVPSNPLVIAPPPNTPVQTYVFTGVSRIYVDVPDFDLPGVNNNTLTIKGISDRTDRIIVAGSGRTASARWSDETEEELQVLFDIEGIDDLTVTAGGVINVSGVFSNDTNDASIKVVATIPENEDDQLAGTVVVAEATPVAGILPQPRLQSNFIEIAGAELDVLGDIVATDHVILRAGENAPRASRANLVLPYDVTVSGNPATAAVGILELYSTKNIEQFPGSTLTASKLVAASNNADVAALDGPWMINLGSEANDFDTISLGMTAVPGDQPDEATQGRIGVRDIDDLTVADFGILALTGQVTLRTGGQLTFDSSVQARGLVAQSDFGIVSTTKADMRILGVPNNDANAAGDIVFMANNSAVGATGGITLNAPIDLGDWDFDGVATSAIHTVRMLASGTTTIAGGLFSPVSTQLLVESDEGIVISSPVQVGSTILDPLSKSTEVFRGGISLVSNGVGSSGITVLDRPGNLGIPQALNATDAISLQSTGDILIAGGLLSGVIYGNPSSLTATDALPSITIRGLAGVDIATTGSLRTQAYQTDPDATTNPLVGKITISGASQINAAGPVTADGAVDIGILGDVTLADVTARENVVVRTSAGSISLQGPMRSTGGTYSTRAPAAGSQREPNVILEAPLGAIATSGLGTISAGIVNSTAFGKILLTAQQDISIGADIVTPGSVTATSKLGLVDMSALVQADNGSEVTVSAGNGILQSDPDLARLVATTLNLLNTGAAGGPSDIDLDAIDNRIESVNATNLTVGGDIRIRNNAGLSVGGLRAERDETQPSTIALASTSGITQTGPIQANDLVVRNSSATAITLTNGLNNVDHFSGINPTGGVSYTDADDFETGVNRAAPLGVEVVGDAVSLSSVAPFSTVRVVSGLAYRTLSIAAGTQSGTTVGTVEFVTTSEGDNGNLSPFAGTLRDMIRYARSNEARYTVNGSVRRQPMALVFDEANYPVEEIVVTSNIPVINVPLSVLGSRLESSVRAAGVQRVGIRGTAGVARGLTFGRGSEESLVDSVSLYGFSQGTSVMVVSGRNAFRNLYVGMNDAGEPFENRIGMLVTSPTAVGNLIGGEVAGGVDPDDGIGNRFVANRAAGIFVDAGASGNRIYGNVIGDETGVRPELANGDGVRIRASAGNLVGTAGTAGLPFAASNVIAGNRMSGVLVLNAMAGTSARANRIQNNVIERNEGVARSNVGGGGGVVVVGSSFVDIGGPAGLGNSVRFQGLGVGGAVDGIRIHASSNVRVIGNELGVLIDEESRTQAMAGNTGHGVAITKSQAIEVSGGNTIGGNAGDGIAIADSSTGVSVTGNLIGLFADSAEAGNTGDGVSIRGAIGNAVSGGNRIAFNRDGVSITDAVAPTLAAGNTVSGSDIFRNLATGVRVVGGSRSTIGGLAAAAGNMIGENDGDGVRLEWSAVTGPATGHAVHGNAIGTDRESGLVNRGNVGSGLVVYGGTGNAVSHGNRVMNNFQSGVDVFGGSGNVIGGAGSAGNVVENNLNDGVQVMAVGTTGWVRFVRVTSGGSGYSPDTTVELGAPTTPGGRIARAVPVIRTVRGVPGVIVGIFVDDPGLGYTPNMSVPVTITDVSGSGATATATATLASSTLTTARDHTVQGNVIRANGASGVAAIGAAVSGLTVGQRITSSGVSGTGNLIEDNIGYGVRVGSGAQRVSTQGNSIFGNLLGAFSVAAGANRSAAQSISLTSAEIRQPSGGGEQLVVRGSLANGRFAQQQYSVDIYASLPEDGDYLSLTGYQARRFLGRATVTTNAQGVATFELRITSPIEVGEVIVATATALRFESGSSSVLSNAVTADYPGIPTPRY